MSTASDGGWLYDPVEPRGSMPNRLTTRLSTHDAASITVRDHDLTGEIMGAMDFGTAVYLLLTGEEPTPDEARLTNAILTSLMVHGMTPHAIATRLTYMAAPESIQGAVASGLLGVGDRFVGAMQACARDLQAVHAAEDHAAAIDALIAEYRDRGEPFPGIGHPHFDPVDPRTERFFELAETTPLDLQHVQLLRRIQSGFETETGLTLPINATGAIAAITSDMGLPPEAARGLAIISRCAGLVAEALEEQTTPIAESIWQTVDHDITYEARD